FLPQAAADAHQDAALDLIGDGCGIDDEAAILRDYGALDLYRAGLAIDVNLEHANDIGVARAAERSDPAANGDIAPRRLAVCGPFFPTEAFGAGLEHFPHPGRRFVLQAEIERVGTGRHGKLVHEGLGDIDVVGRADTAHGAHANPERSLPVR